MFISTATFVLFGSLCVVNPEDPKKWPFCMNFWQNPSVHYKTPKECKEEATRQAKIIKKKYAENKLKIHSLEITCITTGNDVKVDKNYKITYNIL